MQSADDLIAKIKGLQQQIISAATGPVEERSKQLSQLQSQLEPSLEQIELLPEEGRQKVLPVIREFSEQLKKRIDILQQEMHKIRDSAENTKSHANVAKAYSGKIF